VPWHSAPSLSSAQVAGPVVLGLEGKGHHHTTIVATISLQAPHTRFVDYTDSCAWKSRNRTNRHHSSGIRAMSAKASGSDAKPNGSASNREHNQGNQGRKFTPDQKAAVIRVRKCAHTAFYEILGVEKSSTDGEIKKAYRKLSLLTHPDKNGYEGADEAFKSESTSNLGVAVVACGSVQGARADLCAVVSRAFQILSDSEKKEKYDRFGGDPESRFQSSAPESNPFSGFARTPSAAGGRGPMFEEEISPEELFNRFFGGGMGGGFGPFGMSRQRLTTRHI
jgi:hypothetical protein